jgi:hypothetical protein
MPKTFPFRFAALALGALVTMTAAGCIVDARGVGPYGVRPNATAGAVGEPIIQAMSAQPTQTSSKDDVVTFTVVATDPAGQPLQYTWSATKGTLSATTGQTVSWRPIKMDGSVESGLATVSLVVSNGTQAKTGTVNIMIGANGAAQVSGGTTTGAATPSPAASATASPAATAAPTASPSAAASATPSPAATATATPAPSATPTATPTPAASATASPTT